MQHVAARRAVREATALRNDMGRRDELDVQIRLMVEKLTVRVQVRYGTVRYGTVR